MKLKLIFTTILLAALFSYAVPVSANMSTFFVDPIFPTEQYSAINGFFDLRVTAGTRQQFAVRVGNSGGAPIEVSLELITASTNINGIIDYSMPGLTDETLLHDFSEIAEIAPGYELVRIPAGQSVEVPIFVDIPAEGFDGIILGSIHALLEITEEELEQAGMIVNRFAHVIPVRLQENNTEIQSDFALGDVTPTLVNYRAAIVAELRNIVPRLSMGALTHAQIYPEGSDTPIFAMANIEVDFAPNTVFPFTMRDTAGFGLQPGNYTAHIQLEHGGAEWSWEREFEILPQEANTINTAAVNIQQAPPTFGNTGGVPFYIIAAAAGLLIAIVIIVAVLIVRNSKKQAALQNEQFRQQMELLRQSLGQPARPEMGD